MSVKRVLSDVLSDFINTSRRCQTCKATSQHSIRDETGELVCPDGIIVGRHLAATMEFTQDMHSGAITVNHFLDRGRKY